MILFTKLQKNMNKINNVQGFGLIEILVAASLLGIVSVGVMNLVQTATKQQKSLQSKDQQRDFTNDVKHILSNPESCKKTFFNSIVPVVITEIKNANNMVAYSSVVGDPNNFDKSKLLQIKSMKLENYKPNSFAVAGDEGTAEFRISLVRNLNNNNEMLLPDVVILKITKDHVTHKILKCSYIEADTVTDNNVWKKSVTNPNDIYFSGGRVGVNKDSPTHDFQVAGDLALTTALQTIKTNNIEAVDSAAQTKIFEGSQSKIYVSQGDNLVIDAASSNVGIGTDSPVTKLDINGEIKIGASLLACNSSIEGSQKYDFTKHCMSVCNGSTWTCMKEKKPQDCVGAWTACDSATGKRTYIILIVREPGGQQCSNNSGDQSTNCSTTPPATIF